MTVELQPTPAIERNLSWRQLSEPYFPFKYRLEYWLNFLSSVDPAQSVIIDRTVRGSLRHKTPQMKLDQKREALRACNLSNFEKQVVIIAGIDLPELLLKAIPEAREASKYFILSNADRFKVDEYYNLRDEFRRHEGDSEFGRYINLIVKVMPTGETKSFLVDFLRNGNTS